MSRVCSVCSGTIKLPLWSWLKFAAAVIIFVLISGCYSPRAILLETKCGFGRDYICSPMWVEAGDLGNINDNELHLICGCIDKKYLKGN